MVRVQGRIAIIGWASLVWDLDTLTAHVEGGWRTGAGPALPMEFSRISAKRGMGLVVCLDRDDGAVCPTHVIRSRRSGLDDAIADLAARERAPAGRIGAADTAGRMSGRLPELAEAIGAWCAAHGWDGAVWTDLEPNFAARTGRRFSVDAALAYLRGLGAGSLAEARRYIRNAPPTTATPLRRALDADPWWTGLP